MADIKHVPKIDEELLEGEFTNETLGTAIDRLVIDQSVHKYPEVKTPIKGLKTSPWQIMFGIGFILLNLLLLSIAMLVWNGIGIWGNNQPIGWGFDIVNFVWWIGIGHAGTLISAILLLMRQKWRNSINRMAEAMTIFAVMCAGLFPLLHTGRPWVAYWLFPYPNILGMWPQFRSPLIWDVFAVSTYFTVSLLFWYVGLIPDFATVRDKSKKRVGQIIYGMLSLGWRGSAKHWYRYEHASLLLAGLSTPLVLSVHTIVSFDFAVGIVPGWNITIFPPYFVAGAVFGGFAMVLTFAIPLRKWYKLENVITLKHIDWMCKFTLATGLVVFYGYVMEEFFAYYSGVAPELAIFDNRFHITNPYSWAFWCLILFNVTIPQLLWVPKFRRNLAVVMTVCMSVSIGMWFERYVIIPLSLTRDYMPSAYGFYSPTLWDFGMFLGTIGLFIFLMFLFVRFLPMINMFEVKEILHQREHDHGNGKAHKPSIESEGVTS